MNEQKNIFLAIGISIVIIIVFQFLFPYQSDVNKQIDTSNEQISPANSIDDTQSARNTIIQSKEEVIVRNKRVTINTPSLSGSINLTGAILDDLILIKYNESLKNNSKKITLFSPDGTSNPYYFELGWKQLSENSSVIDLPNLSTEWQASGSELTPNKTTRTLAKIDTL